MGGKVQRTPEAKLTAMQKLKAKHFYSVYAEEHLEQCALMDWARLYSEKTNKDPLTMALQRLFAIPNGGYRVLTTAQKLKAEGVRSGVSDLFMAWPIAIGKVDYKDLRNFYSGLWIEMKGRGKYTHLTPTQLQWMKKMEDDYACCVAYGWEEARDYIVEYVLGQWPGHELRSSRPLQIARVNDLRYGAKGKRDETDQPSDG
jgi:hypothetical protein